MIHFDNDYAEGAHEEILQRLQETNRQQAPGYGLDEYSERARDYIKKASNNKDIDVHFLSSGTQTNLIVIASSLRPYQGVITADTGHIYILETGAIEATGHKILPLPSKDGKITAKQIEEACIDYWNDEGKVHRVEPGMVYLSNPTETGTLYSKAELEKIKKVCQQYHLKLFIDGARLGYGLVAETNDLSLSDLTKLCDVFYIGGTKIGALLGEAIIISNEEIKKGFRAMIKQRGGLLAKGRTLGIQFEVLFEDNLYFELSKHAVQQAMKIKKALLERKIPLKYEAYTNQLFPIFSKDQLEFLHQKYNLLEMEAEDENHSVVRLCTSWATRTDHVEELINDISKLKSDE